MALLQTERRYTGRIIHLDVDTVSFPDGSTGQLEMIRHPGASAVVPFLDPVTDSDPRILLIRQFRHAAQGYIWEIPAGRLDAGETPERCAERELAEETGMRAEKMTRLSTIFTTPGFTDERIHLFAATGLRQGPSAREVDEFLEIHEVRWSEILKMLNSGEISDGKTIAGLALSRCFTT
ncbi:MAG: NUDIX hydrolase [Gemmatimonadota bacterium]